MVKFALSFWEPFVIDHIYNVCPLQALFSVQIFIPPYLNAAHHAANEQCFQKKG